MKYLYLACLGVAAILVFVSLRIGWRPDSPQFGLKRNAEVQASAREVEALCSQAQLVARGIRIGDHCDDVGRKLLEIYGRPMAATLEKACDTDRLIVDNDLLFFPAKSLCQRSNLPSTCASLCNKWRSGNARQR